MGKVAIIGGVTCAFTLAALALVAYHTELRCSSKVGDVKTTECPATWEDHCPGAYAIGGSGEVTGTEFSFKYACPWEKETAILGLIGLSLTQIFLGILLFLMRGKNLKTPMIALTGLIVPVLLATFGLMIRDLKRGFDFADDAGTTDGLKPGTYIANIILLFIGVCLISTGAYLGNKHAGKH